MCHYDFEANRKRMERIRSLFADAHGIRRHVPKRNAVFAHSQPLAVLTTEAAIATHRVRTAYDEPAIGSAKPLRVSFGVESPLVTEN